MTPSTLLLALLACSQPDPGSGAVVRLRGGDEVRAEMHRVTPEALVVRTEGREVLIGWERVAETTGVLLTPRQREDAAATWRAVARATRGDYVNAEPLLETLFPSVRGRIGPTPAAVSGALLRCRLARGAVVGAVESMLSLAGAHARGDDDWLVPEGAGWARERDPAPMHLVWDEGMGLSPGVPPMWVALPGVVSLARAGERLGDGLPEGRATRLAAIYAHALRHEAGEPTTLPDRPEFDDALRFVHDVVAARTGEGAERDAAVARLRATIAGDVPAWVRVWGHAAIGRALLRSADVETRLLGVAEVLRVPAAYERELPYVTGLCLAEAAAALLDLGERGGASSLYLQLAERFPEHPALAWEALGPLREARAGRTTRATDTEAQKADGT